MGKPRRLPCRKARSARKDGCFRKDAVLGGFLAFAQVDAGHQDIDLKLAVSKLWFILLGC